LLINHRPAAAASALPQTSRQQRKDDGLPSASVTEAQIREWCAQEIAQILGLAPDQIDHDTKFARLGLDSANAMQLILALEGHLGIELYPETVFDHPTIAELSRQLFIEAGGKGDT
jgi:acyl carrier protein